MLQGKVGIITGAGGGIGRAIALELGRLGAAVIVNDIGAALDGGSTGSRPADEVVAAIAAEGGRAVADHGSVTEYPACEAMVQRALDSFGRLDFVVHNAGILRDRVFHKLAPEDFDAVLAVHVGGGFRICRAAAGHFRQQGSGAFVLMTSTSGLIGNVGQSAYATAKLGLVALTRGIALDMRRFGVRANAIAPFAWTRMTASIPGAEDDPRLANLRRCTPEQIAPVVAWLASDEAAEVNGQIFVVRGGELGLFDPPRPGRAVIHPGGWTSANVGQAMASLRPAMAGLQTTGEVYGYDVP